MNAPASNTGSGNGDAANAQAGNGGAQINLHDYIAAVADFPKPGILFRDITPLLADPAAFRHCIERLAEVVSRHGATDIIGIESRGFMFGAALSHSLQLPFHVVRKPGKLPRATYSEQYALEYGEDSLHLHVDALASGARVAVIDDLIATGGTAEATCRLIRKSGAELACCAFVIELSGLSGRARLADCPVESLLVFD